MPLSAQYFNDDAIIEAGPDAELLFVRCLSFLASVATDGFITERQLTSIVARGLRAPQKRIDALVNVGLLEPVSGGFLVRSWLKWNRSAEQVGKLQLKDRERKARKQAEVGANSARNPSGIQSDSADQSSTEQSSTEQSSTEQSTTSNAHPGGGHDSSPSSASMKQVEFIRELLNLLGRYPTPTEDDELQTLSSEAANDWIQSLVAERDAAPVEVLVERLDAAPGDFSAAAHGYISGRRLQEAS